MKHTICVTLIAIAAGLFSSSASAAVLVAADTLAIEAAIVEYEAEANAERAANKVKAEERRRVVVRKIFANLGKAVGIVVLLLLVRAVILWIGKKAGKETTYDNVRQGDAWAILFVGSSSQEEAAGIARSLVDERLAACANILSGTAIRPPGGEPASNAWMVVKTARRRLKSVTRRIRELHQSPVPEIIPYPIEHGLKSYLDWVLESTDSKPWWHRA